MRRSELGFRAEPRSEKPLAWWGSALQDLRAFPDDARQAAGRQLRRLQQGELPNDWKPMAAVGPGTIEIRLHTGSEHRVFVVVKFEDAVHVLHSFEKKSEKTSRRDIALAKRRYQDLMWERRSR